MYGAKRHVWRSASQRLGLHSVVMVALVATIHDFFGGAEMNGRQKKTWMVGTRPTMTILGV